MNVIEILLIAVALAMDAFAVALSVGTLRLANGPRAAFRLSFHFGLFQLLMPVLGWFAGATISNYISAVDHWIAFGLLAFVGGRMVRSSLDPDGVAFATDPSRGRTLVMLAVATSIDAFAVGLGLAMLQVNIVYPSTIIGIVAASFTLLGLKIGNQLGQWFGKRMELAGGLVLIGIGVRVLFSHLL